MVYGQVEDFLASNHVEQQFSLPYEHKQNLVERHVQTVVKTVTAVLHDQKYLNSSFWDYCLFYTIQAMNHRPNVKTNGSTPEQLVYKKPPVDLNRMFLFPFGTPVSIQKPNREWRFDTRRDLGIYLGNIEGSVNGGLVYIPSTGAICARGDLTELKVSPRDFHRYSNTSNLVRGSESNDESLTIPDIDNLNMISDPSNHQGDEQRTTLGTTSPEQTNSVSPTEANSKKSIISRRRAKQYIRRILTRSQSKLGSQLSAFIVQKINELDQALDGPEKDHRQIALQEEVDSLFKITETIIPETPEPNSDYDVINATVVLKKKMRDEFTIEMYKARICACGNELVMRHNYVNETFSPTVSSLVHSLLLQLAITMRIHTATFDTVAAYLQQIYPETLKPLYIRFPKRIAQAGKLEPSQLYRVRKYLYGLPDAGRAYYLALSNHLRNNGYVMSIHDPCLFFKWVPTTAIRVLVWTHVDDMFVATSHTEEIEILHDVLKKRFPIKMNTTIDAHLGISMTPQKDGSIKLTQPKLIADILQSYPTKSKNKYPAKPFNKAETSKPIDVHEYLKLLGKQLYLTSSRPDIMTSVSYAATKNKSPTQLDFDRLLDTVSGLSDTADVGLVIYPATYSCSKIKLTAFVDAAYMSHSDGDSHTGYTIALSAHDEEPRSYFHSKSQKQKLVATSSTHAEIRALYQLTLQLIFISNLLHELGIDVELPITVF